MIKLTDAIDWQSFEDDLFANFSQITVISPCCLFAGCVHDLKYVSDVGNEVDHWWMAWKSFTARILPVKLLLSINTRPISRRCHATQKICSSGAEKILEVSLKTRLREGFIKKSELTWGNVSSIVQEKAIRDPTDVRLYDRLWERLVNLYVKRAFELQQTYERIEKRFCAAQTVLRKPISSGRREKR